MIMSEMRVWQHWMCHRGCSEVRYRIRGYVGLMPVMDNALFISNIVGRKVELDNGI